MIHVPLSKWQLVQRAFSNSRNFKLNIIFSNWAQEERNGPPHADQGLSKSKPRQNHAVCTLWVQSPVAPFLLLKESPEDIGKETSQTESLMIGFQSLVVKALRRDSMIPMVKVESYLKGTSSSELSCSTVLLSTILSTFVILTTPIVNEAISQDFQAWPTNQSKTLISSCFDQW